MVLGVAFVLAGIWAGYSLARSSDQPAQAGPGAAADAGATPSPGDTAHPGFASLQRSVTGVLSAAGATGAVTMTELAGPGPRSWAYNGDEQFVAASTYKLPLLMEEAQGVAAGRWHGTDSLCYQDGDWEDGYYTDYQDGMCLSRSQLDNRAGQASDNTAAHVLVRYDGGGDALNRYARSHGARESAFYDPNSTTTNDLARLWVDEAGGRAGGRAAQQYLYPMLVHTLYEDGIPAGLPQGTPVFHKVGILEGEVNDAALVRNGPRDAYVLAICTQGPGGDAGWKVLADISRAVWDYERTR
jgi:beta-lactamase class A